VNCGAFPFVLSLSKDEFAHAIERISSHALKPCAATEDTNAQRGCRDGEASPVIRVIPGSLQSV
jgi:hypothetical protein